jgi:hypothetical protein
MFGNDSNKENYIHEYVRNAVKSDNILLLFNSERFIFLCRIWKLKD